MWATISRKKKSKLPWEKKNKINAAHVSRYASACEFCSI